MKKSILALCGILAVGILATALLLGSFRVPRMMRAYANTNKTNITQNYATQQTTAAKTSFDEIVTAKVNGNIQTVTTSMAGGTYFPIIVQKGIPVKWVVTAKDGDINSCNNQMILSSFNIDKNLSTGENVIAFTPTESGTFTYSCWMGMVTSTITVVDDINNITPQDKTGYSENAALHSGGGCNMSSNGGGNCCGIN